jgi:hypothetical protein
MGRVVESSMAGLLFFIDVFALVLVAYWAYRNGGIGLDESGTGLFAIKGGTRPRVLAVKPRWARTARDKTDEQIAKPPKGWEPRWKAESQRWGEQKR